MIRRRISLLVMMSIHLLSPLNLSTSQSQSKSQRMTAEIRGTMLIITVGMITTSRADRYVIVLLKGW
jgi:hypothetical protein